MAEWVRALACAGDRSVYPALPVSFGGDTQSRGSRVSGVYRYARGSKISHSPHWNV